MWVSKLGGTQAKLNKSALKRGRLKSMVKIWEDLQTTLGKKQERKKKDFGKYGNKIQWPLLPFPIQILSKITLLKWCGWSAGFIVNVKSN